MDRRLMAGRLREIATEMLGYLHGRNEVSFGMQRCADDLRRMAGELDGSVEVWDLVVAREAARSAL